MAVSVTKPKYASLKDRFRVIPIELDENVSQYLVADENYYYDESNFTNIAETLPEYRLFGIVGFSISGSNSSYLNIHRLETSSSSYSEYGDAVGVKNMSSKTVTPTFIAYTLWYKFL